MYRNIKISIAVNGYLSLKSERFSNELWHENNL